MDRRKLLAGGVAAGALGVAGVAAQTTDTPTASDLKASITWNSATYTYPDGPEIPSYYVSFRPDGRIVFHLGASGDLTKAHAQPEPYHMGPHHMKIEKGSSIVFEADIPAHWWNAEWTYRPTPIALKRTPAQIVAANRMFAYGNTGANIAPQTDYVFKGPMDSAGITKYMPTTGERPDIGLITDPSAYFMLGGKPGPMLAWAQAAGSCPIHFRDEKTGKPIDLIKYPGANSYSEEKQGSPWLLAGPAIPKAPIYREFGGGWHPQQAHYCEMSYLAHLATLDPGFLEDLQYSANFTVLCDGYMSAQRGIATIYGEYRGIAWAFRNLFMAHAATQDVEAAGTLPATCHPSSYWKNLLDNQLTYYSKSMDDPNQQLWRLVATDGMWGPWQVDYMLTSLAFGILTGHSDWTPLYLWALGNVIARTNGTSGFPPGYGTPYYMGTVPGGEVGSLPRFKSWGEAFDEIFTSANPNIRNKDLTQAAYDSLKSDPLNGGKAFAGGEYMMTTRAALIMAACLEKKGLANVRATYPELDKCIATVDRMVRSVNARVSVIL